MAEGSKRRRIFPAKSFSSDISTKKLLADYYANADVFVHPNPKEPFGIAPLEAMASGVPTVAPDAGGILSYATDENAGWSSRRAQNSPQRSAKSSKIPIYATEKSKTRSETALDNTREKSTDNLLADLRQNV